MPRLTIAILLMAFLLIYGGRGFRSGIAAEAAPTAEAAPAPPETGEACCESGDRLARLLCLHRLAVQDIEITQAVVVSVQR